MQLVPVGSNGNYLDQLESDGQCWASDESGGLEERVSQAVKRGGSFSDEGERDRKKLKKGSSFKGEVVVHSSAPFQGSISLEQKRLKELAFKKRMKSLAKKINRDERALKYMNLSEEEFFGVAPYLTYVDCTGAPFSQWSSEKLERFISLCSRVENLYIRSSKIQKLPDLPNCIELDCSGCPVLLALGNLIKCVSLNCSYCPSLRDFPYTPNLERYEFEGCSDVITSAMNPFKYGIEELDSNPKDLLLPFVKFLSRGKAVKQVIPLEKGVASEAEDYGGVMRSFITTLMENLVNRESKDDGDIFGFVDGDGGRLPSYKGNQFRQEMEFYQAIGDIFSFCLKSKGDYLVGDLFDQSLFDLIASFSCDDLEKVSFSEGEVNLHIETEDVVIKSFRALNQRVPLYKKAFDFLDGKKFSYEQQYELTFLVGWELSDGEPIDQKKLASEIKKQFISNAKKEGLISIGLVIAKEMIFKAGDEKTWNRWCSSGGAVLQEKIQGKLSPGLLKASFSWGQGLDVSYDSFFKTKMNLFKWIDACSDSELKRFVFSVTGSNSLGRNSLEVFMFSGGPERFPKARTCNSALELSVDYPDFEAFKEKMDIFLEHATNGTGFQMA